MIDDILFPQKATATISPIRIDKIEKLINDYGFEFYDFSSPDLANSFAFMSQRLLKLFYDFTCRLSFEFEITSGFRTIEHNKKVGGTPNSSHLMGQAVDIKLKNGFERWEALEAAKAAGFKRIGVYPWGLHLDCDRQKASPILWS